MINKNNNTDNINTDLEEAYVTTPVNKLDADQYSADDLDGVTESLFGSGNLAYASMQASQTDQALDTNASNITNTDLHASNIKTTPLSVYEDSSQAITNIASGDPTKFGQVETTDTDRLLEGSAPTNNINSEGLGNFTSSTVGSIGASTLSSDAGSFAPTGSGLNLSKGLNGNDGQSSESADGQNGNNGQDGQDAMGKCDTKNINIVNVDIDLGDVTGDTITIINNGFVNINNTINNVNISLDSTINIVNDIVVDILVGDIVDISSVTATVQNISTNLLQTVTSTVQEIADVKYALGDLIQNIVSDTGDKDVLSTIGNKIANLESLDQLGDALAILGSGIQKLHITIDKVGAVVSDLELDNAGHDLKEVLVTIDNTTTTLIEKVDGVVGEILDDLDLGGGEVGDVLDGLLGHNANGTDSDITAETDIDLLNQDIIDPIVDIAIDPVEDIIGDVDLDINLATDLLSGGSNETDNAAGDSDITLETGIEIVDNTIAQAVADVSLDLVEEITGDIDLDLGIAADLLGDTAEPIVNEGEGGTGQESLLSHIGDTLADIVEHVVPGLNSNEDSQSDVTLESDVTLDSGIDALDETIADTGIELTVNPIEEIIGDIDLDISSAIDLLNAHETETDAAESIDDAHGDNWTECIISEGAFDDVLDGLHGDGGNALPDLLGTVGEGLGVLDTEPNIDVNALGGLFG